MYMYVFMCKCICTCMCFRIRITTCMCINLCLSWYACACWFECRAYVGKCCVFDRVHTCEYDCACMHGWPYAHACIVSVHLYISIYMSLRACARVWQSALARTQEINLRGKITKLIWKQSQTNIGLDRAKDRILVRATYHDTSRCMMPSYDV